MPDRPGGGVRTESNEKFMKGPRCSVLYGTAGGAGSPWVRDLGEALYS